MPAIRRISDAPYRWDIIDASLSEVANQERLLPPDFISADGFRVTAAARRYLAPLIVGEAYPPFKNGLPEFTFGTSKPAGIHGCRHRGRPSWAITRRSQKPMRSDEFLEDDDGIEVLKVVHVEAAHDPADPDRAASALLPFERPYQ